MVKRRNDRHNRSFSVEDPRVFPSEHVRLWRALVGNLDIRTVRAMLDPVPLFRRSGDLRFSLRHMDRLSANFKGEQAFA